MTQEMEANFTRLQRHELMQKYMRETTASAPNRKFRKLLQVVRRIGDTEPDIQSGLLMIACLCVRFGKVIERQNAGGPAYQLQRLGKVCGHVT